MRRALVLMTALLAGCATVPPPAMPPPDWEARRAVAEGLANWRMTGRVAVAVGEEGGSAGVDWRQLGPVSEVSLTGPLGVGGLRAMLDPRGLTLEDGRGEQFHGEMAEALLHARLGAPVPFGHLRYWLLGAPAPGEPFQPVSQPGDAPAFSQSGWTVGIDRLEPASGHELPMRISVSRPDARLKLVVTRWDLEP
jgi:outer membrane lipoprotein LolB